MLSRPPPSRCGPAPTRTATSAAMERMVREAAGAGRDLCPDAGNDRRAHPRQGGARRGLHHRGQGHRRRRRLAACRANSASILHVGSTAILRTDGKLANRALLFGPDGAIVASYDKIHMFDVDLDNGESWRESAAYEPGTRGGRRRPAARPARLRRLLRRAFPAAFPRRGAGRRRGADRARRLHPPDRRGALACAAARPRHRERRLRDRRRAGRPARGRPRDLWPFDDRRSMGQHPRRGRP